MIWAQEDPCHIAHPQTCTVTGSFCFKPPSCGTAATDSGPRGAGRLWLSPARDREWAVCFPDTWAQQPGRAAEPRSSPGAWAGRHCLRQLSEPLRRQHLRRDTSSSPASAGLSRHYHQPLDEGQEVSGRLVASWCPVFLQGGKQARSPSLPGALVLQTLVERTLHCDCPLCRRVP